MPATPSCPNTDHYSKLTSDWNASRKDLPQTNSELGNNSLELELHGLEITAIEKNSYQAPTDLVRLYLQDIGRVPLLGKEEEVTKAQQVQSYVELVTLRDAAAKEGDQVMQKLVEMVELHDRLLVTLGYRPSWNRWAKEGQISVVELKEILAQGKQRWAELAEVELAALEKSQKLGIKAKDQMIKANLRLVVSVAKKYQHRGLELLDLIQEGTLGLERAVEKFDPTKGYRFSTYAYWWIRQGITRAISTQSRIIRLPVHVTEKLNKIKRAQRKLSQEKGRKATIEEMSQELEMTAEQIREVLSRIPRSVSLEIKVGKDRDTELVDLLETECQSPEENLISESLSNDLQELLGDLTPREQDVIKLRYGFEDGTSYSLAEIGRTLELSRERVRQIEAKALQKLRQPRKRNQIRDYFEALN
ncbi:MAG TPA: RNA polymerase sigma factor, RpoD/SigA family [Cyanothece sp. UBA12306]|nr:RNA polymerase sigma factor, RpoD/SigA family [Cyanothece sp. UBA12306]